MAIIGKIRDNGWLVLVLVGAALIAFILGDWSRITGGDEPKYGIGTINGEKVDVNKFNEAVDIATENAKRAAQQQNQPYQEVDRTAVWRSFVERQLLEAEYEALGINVSENEFDAYLYASNGFAVLPDFATTFVDSTTKTFNPKLLEARIEEMKNSEDANVRKAWDESKEYYTDKRRQEKYFDVLGQGVYVTKLEAKNEYLSQKEIKNISYVVKRYRDIPDSEINVTDEQLMAYFEKHKSDKKHQNRESSREVRYFDIMINPSGEDSSKFNSKIAELKSGFATTSDDSSFVMKNSENRFFTSGPFSTAVPKTHKNAQQSYFTFPAYLDTTFESASVGQIVGPYEHDGATVIAKVLGFTSDTINARHILLNIPQGQEAEKQALADSIMEQINDENFEDFVAQYSDDQGSKIKGGDLGDFFFSQMVPPFAAFCADKPIGEIGQVRSQFGIHIVQVTARKGKKYPRLAVIQNTLKPSDETMTARKDEAYDLLYKLDGKLSKIEDPVKKVEMFDTLANEAGYFPRPVRIQDNSPTLYGFTINYAEDKVLELAYREDAKVGDLVNAPIKDKNKHVIAILSAIRLKGEPSFNDVKLVMERNYIEDQKVKRFQSEMRGKELASIPGGTVQRADVTLANPQITGAGFEPEVVGAIFSALKDGDRSLPIRGKTGVYVVKVEKTTKAPATNDYTQEQKQLLGSVRGNLQNSVKKALTVQSEVIDNRRLFNIGVRR